ncbi:hypothetical protein CEUSTIGMA_g1773.t1 [Chlamydomonas eustigma]|uniref:Protein DPCD n=1 Tax=Chlamydomonas eustigma TaxID=1157962 RepID=A0A250WU27_9CHLO|nr:hypothetical protein CEUSTIGMA_g1773.t1 [Chlamydomonas eustigma]|eukprot:GAX74324.1 hypothetical protein CEUSTIGMA_g1773.t1 [Chlamydomonas eustigma]
MFREGGNSTAIISGGRRKVHTTFDDGGELVEEYDVKTGELLERRRRGKTVLGRQADWEYLIGESPMKWNPEGGTLKESHENPLFTRKDTRDTFQWRVRNLPYPPETYDISLDHEKRQIVIRTSNKKYFKRIGIPELDKLGLPLMESALAWTHANNTLIVSYAKPPIVLQARQRKLRTLERSGLKRVMWIVSSNDVVINCTTCLCLIIVSMSHFFTASTGPFGVHFRASFPKLWCLFCRGPIDLDIILLRFDC